MEQYADIKSDVFKNLGNNVFIKHYDGRNKTYNYCGKIIECYSQIFIILLSDGCKKCFRYGDILTKTIEMEYKF